jgi:O-6-methylguanine DNA methyltransferase
MEAAGQVSHHRVIALDAAASRPGVDPCDVACDAMPAHVAGDLTLGDESWLHQHTATCNSCRIELHRYDRLSEALATAGQFVPPNLTPPAVKLPRPERVWLLPILSPVGELLLAATQDGVREIEFASSHSEEAFVAKLREHGVDPVRLERIEEAPADVRSVLERTATQLREYFGGHRDRFDVPLDWGRMAPFQRAVLEATAAVPFGALDTYAGIARKIGKPRATRAVGNALGRNPIPVIVPCHRIVRSDATLGGYTGGLQIKQHLLSLEGVTLA